MQNKFDYSSMYNCNYHKQKLVLIEGKKLYKLSETKKCTHGETCLCTYLSTDPNNSLQFAILFVLWMGIKLSIH